MYKSIVFLTLALTIIAAAPPTKLPAALGPLSRFALIDNLMNNLKRSGLTDDICYRLNVASIECFQNIVLKKRSNQPNLDQLFRKFVKARTDQENEVLEPSQLEKLNVEWNAELHNYISDEHTASSEYGQDPIKLHMKSVLTEIIYDKPNNYVCDRLNMESIKCFNSLNKIQ